MLPTKQKIVIQCCVCKRVRAATGRFRKMAIPHSMNVSHTYCPTCATEAKKRLQTKRQAAAKTPPATD